MPPSPAATCRRRGADMQKMQQWTMLTALGVVGVLVAGWFLLVSPQRSHAASLRAQAVSQESANASLQSQVNQLEQQKKGLPAQQRQLNKIAARVPDNPELPALIRQLSSAADDAGVDLVSLAPSAPAPVVDATGAAPVTAAGTLAAPAAASPLVKIQLALTVQGSYYNVESFFQQIEKLTRAMTVQQWTLTPVGGAGASATGTSAQTSATGKKVPPGALSAVITGSVFESPAAAAQTPAVPSSPAAPATAQ